ncbi:hypothetical protein BDZ45DRAFT_54891 [Acephala macrosclerotiorum]|nr:hypothetical protein BDZ45DRAFT_54891 [Acephala macrosclerotiorum]
MYSPSNPKQQPFSPNSTHLKQRISKTCIISKQTLQPSTMDREFNSYYSPKTWDFAYPTGHAPPPTSPHLQSINQPFFRPTTPIKDRFPTPNSFRKPSTMESKFSTPSNENAETETRREATLATPPETPKSPTTFLKKIREASSNADLDSMPAWARSLPKEVFVGSSLKDGVILFPTNSMPRSAVIESGSVGNVKHGEIAKRGMKGINRPGHPTLKLERGEFDPACRGDFKS